MCVRVYVCACVALKLILYSCRILQFQWRGFSSSKYNAKNGAKYNAKNEAKYNVKNEAKTKHNAKDLSTTSSQPVSSARCEVPSADCDLPSADCEVPSADCEVPIAECEAPSVNFEPLY